MHKISCAAGISFIVIVIQNIPHLFALRNILRAPVAKSPTFMFTSFPTPVAIALLQLRVLMNLVFKLRLGHIEGLARIQYFNK